MTLISSHNGHDAAFLASLLKDIKSERPKITEKDNLRLLFVTKWFLEYFLAVRTQEKSAGASEPWAFGLVGEVIERGWIVWVLKRMNGAVEEKVGAELCATLASFYLRIMCVMQPKLWTELQAGIECLTQLLALLEAMSSTKTETDEAAELHEAALLLQQQLVYNGQVLDAALDGLRVYKDGTQSLMFLRSSVHLTYALMRMLEKWAKTTGDGSYVRKRAKPKKKRKAKGACKVFFFLSLSFSFLLRSGSTLTGPSIIVHSTEEEPDGVPDAEEEELAEREPEDDVIEETMFTFESFELVRGRSRCGDTHVEPSLLTRTPEIRECGHHAVATDLHWASQRIHVIRGDETRGQPAASTGRACQGRRTVLPSGSTNIFHAFLAWGGSHARTCF